MGEIIQILSQEANRANRLTVIETNMKRLNQLRFGLLTQEYLVHQGYVNK